MVIDPELVKKRKKPLKNILNILSNEKRELKDYDPSVVEMLNTCISNVSNLRSLLDGLISGNTK